MDYKELIARYIASETQYPLKTERIRKLNELLNDLRASESNFTLSEIEASVRQFLANDTVIRIPFFSYVIYPVIEKGIEHKDVRAIKILLSLIQQLYQYQNFTKQHIYTSTSLINQGLQIDPSDKELLTLQESSTRSYLLCTLHELPRGVLYGQNGASIQECDELLEHVTDCEQACHKLQIDRSDLVSKCKFYYLAYKNYLVNRSLYRDFEDYLAKDSKNET